jgi:hypothetical protein
MENWLREELDSIIRNYKSGINESESLEEAIYKGRKVPLRKIMRGDVKKFKVYVNSGKKDSEGNIIASKVNFGHRGSSVTGEKTMEIKRDNPERRKAFRARFNCDNPGPDTSARYWSCRTWTAKDKVSDLLKEIIKEELKNLT